VANASHKKGKTGRYADEKRWREPRLNPVRQVRVRYKKGHRWISCSERSVKSFICEVLGDFGIGLVIRDRKAYLENIDVRCKEKAESLFNQLKAVVADSLKVTLERFQEGTFVSKMEGLPMAA
jgi:hypothetical protein